MAYANQVFWPWGSWPVAGNTQGFNNNTTRYGIKFVPPATKTLNEVRVYPTAITGTPTTSLEVILYEQTSRYGTSFPGPSITALQTSTGFTPVAGTWLDVTGFTTSLTKNKTYCILVRNKNVSPGSHHFTLRTFQPNNYGSEFVSANSSNGTDVSFSSVPLAMRLKFSDGSYCGYVPSAWTTNSTYDIYTTREFGQRFTMPVTVTASGICMHHVAKNGTPTGNPRFRYYTGTSPSLVETIEDVYISANGTNTGTLNFGYFASPIEIAAGTVCNLTFGETTNSDTSSNTFRPVTMTWDSDANSAGLIPFDNAMVYYDGTTWTTPSNLHVPSVGFLLENGDEYPAGGGGSAGVRFPRTFTGF